MPNYGYPKWLTARPYAHRGLHDSTRPENSLSAMDAAIARNFGIEVDVNLSKDGEVIIFHDRNLLRMCGRPERVIDLTADELADIPYFDFDETIPTLTQGLRLIDNRVPLLIEIKTRPGEQAGALEEAVADAIADYQGPVAVMSFSPESMEWFATYAPQHLRGQIATDFIDEGYGLNWKSRRELTNLDSTAISQPDFIAYNIQNLPQAAVRQYRASGLPILTWTVRNPDLKARAERYTDQIIFEGFDPE